MNLELLADIPSYSQRPGIPPEPILEKSFLEEMNDILRNKNEEAKEEQVVATEGVLYYYERSANRGKMWLQTPLLVNKEVLLCRPSFGRWEGSPARLMFDLFDVYCLAKKKICQDPQPRHPEEVPSKPGLIKLGDDHPSVSMQCLWHLANELESRLRHAWLTPIVIKISPSSKSRFLTLEYQLPLCSYAVQPPSHGLLEQLHRNFGTYEELSNYLDCLIKFFLLNHPLDTTLLTLRFCKTILQNTQPFYQKIRDYSYLYSKASVLVDDNIKNEQ
jgi:hypothetical protein